MLSGLMVQHPSTGLTGPKLVPTGDCWRTWTPVVWQFSSNKAAKAHHSITVAVGVLVASLSHRLLSHSLILWVIHSLSRFQTSKPFSTSSPVNNFTVQCPKLEHIVIFVVLLIDPNPNHLNCTVCIYRLPPIGCNQVIASFHVTSSYFLICFKFKIVIMLNDSL